MISAVGGKGPNAGGGGRILVVTPDLSTYDPARLRAEGGHGTTTAGAAGTVMMQVGPTATLVIDNAELAPAVEGPPWAELGARAASAVTSNSVTVDGTALATDILVGREVWFEGATRSFTIVANNGNTLSLDPADGAATTVAGAGTKLTCGYSLAAELVVSGGARVSLADRLDVDTLISG